MSKILARESLYLEHQVDINAQEALGHRISDFYLAKVALILVLITSMGLLGLLQVRLFCKIISYKQEITALEESIRDLTIKNERLRKEVEALSSPTRLREEAERLGLQPSDKLIDLPIN